VSANVAIHTTHKYPQVRSISISLSVYSKVSCVWILTVLFDDLLVEKEMVLPDEPLEGPEEPLTVLADEPDEDPVAGLPEGVEAALILLLGDADKDDSGPEVLEEEIDTEPDADACVDVDSCVVEDAPIESTENTDRNSS